MLPKMGKDNSWTIALLKRPVPEDDSSNWDITDRRQQLVQGAVADAERVELAHGVLQVRARRAPVAHALPDQAGGAIEGQPAGVLRVIAVAT